MPDNLIIPRQFMLDTYAAKMQQLRGLQAEIAQLERLLGVGRRKPSRVVRNDGVPLIEPVAENGREGDPWS